MAITMKIDLLRLRDDLHGRGKIVAQKMGITPVQLSKKVRGRALMRIEDLNAIVRFLDRDVREYLIWNEDDKKSENKNAA